MASGRSRADHAPPGEGHVRELDDRRGCERDRHGHLMPANEDEAAALLDAYLERANTRGRLDQISGDRRRRKGPFWTETGRSRSPVVRQSAPQSVDFHGLPWTEHTRSR